MKNNKPMAVIKDTQHWTTEETEYATKLVQEMGERKRFEFAMKSGLRPAIAAHPGLYKTVESLYIWIIKHRDVYNWLVAQRQGNPLFKERYLRKTYDVNIKQNADRLSYGSYISKPKFAYYDSFTMKPVKE